MRRLSLILFCSFLPLAAFSDIADFMDNQSNNTRSSSLSLPEPASIHLDDPFFVTFFEILTSARYTAYPFCEINEKFIVYPLDTIQQPVYPDVRVKNWYLTLEPAFWGSFAAGWGGRVDMGLRLFSLLRLNAGSGILADGKAVLLENSAGLGISLFLWDGLSLLVTADGVFWGGYKSVNGYRILAEAESWYFRPFHFRGRAGVRNMGGVVFMEGLVTAGVLLNRFEFSAGWMFLEGDFRSLSGPRAAICIYF